MVKVGLLVQLQAKAGKEAVVAKFLADALALANQEAGTLVWFALQSGPSSFAIFDAFADDTGRRAHLAVPLLPHSWRTPQSCYLSRLKSSKWMCLPQSFRRSQEYLSGTRAVVRRKRAEVSAFWVQQPNWWLDRPKPVVHFDGERDRRGTLC